jgi:VCBS repeat-containing protein/probable HAF family extracellular repeat protein
MPASNKSSKSSQATDDTFSWTENDLIASGLLQGNIVWLDVLANDRGGNGKQLWSAGGNGNANATISDGKILYDFTASLAALGADNIDALTVDDHIHEEFVYAIRFGNGALSQATVVIDLWGINDPASISGDPTGSTVEDSSTTAGGVLTVNDVDHGQNVFRAVAETALVGAYGDFTFDQKTGAWGYTLDHGRADSLGYGEVVHDTLTVVSADGTASQVIDVTVNGTIDAPVVTASAAQSSIKQGDAVGLNIAATDVDAAAALSYAVTGVPLGAALTSEADPGGVSYDAGSQTWLVSAGALADLTLTPDAEFTGEIDLTVTVTNTEANPNNAGDIATAAVSAPIAVTVNSYTLTYAWTMLNVLGADSTTALGLNDSDQVVGYYLDGTGSHGFLFDGGVFTTLDAAPPYYDTTATAINATGEVAGYFDDDLGSHGFVFDGSEFTVIDPAEETFFTYAGSINNAGEVVGYYYDVAGIHGFLYDGSTSVPLDASTSAFFTFATGINNLGEVTGYYQDETGSHGFIYDDGLYTLLDDPSPDALYVVTSAINDAGAVAGYYGDSVGIHGFVYDDGIYTPCDVPGAHDTIVFDFNDVGQVLGAYVDGAGQHGFIYNTGSATFTTLDDPSALGGTAALALNNSGSVAGYGGDHGFLAVPN